MKHETTDGEPSVATGRGGTVRRVVSNLVSYALFAVALVGFYAFFAPHLGTPAVGFAAVLPEIAAPTEGQAVVNAAPLIVGAVASGVAVWLR